MKNHKNWGRGNKEKIGDYREEMQSPWGGKGLTHSDEVNGVILVSWVTSVMESSRTNNV
jgi:hypothetical protein